MNRMDKALEQYEIIRSKRKTTAIEITPEGSVRVRAPLHVPLKEIQKIVAGKSAWIEAHLQKMAARKAAALPPFTVPEKDAFLQAAKRDLPFRVAEFATQMGVSYGRITLRCQKTRWGSCSSKGNLNFNYLLMCCPEEIRDYVVVHELCHLTEMNHSKRFWQAVAQVMPDYAKRRKWLKEHGNAVIQRVK